MKYCSRCGNELTEKDVFCSKCGAKASRYAVDSLDKKPDAGKTEKHAALIGESVPGARYTAAVEKNAIGVTEYLRRAADLELMRYGINRIGWSLELKEAETVKKVEAEDEALKTFREKEENVEKRINDYQKREYRGGSSLLVRGERDIPVSRLTPRNGVAPSGGKRHGTLSSTRRYPNTRQALGTGQGGVCNPHRTLLG